MVKVRGQLSIEFIVVISGLLIILAATTMPMYNQARVEAEKVSKLADAREAAGEITNALNTVYAAGVGSKQTVEYRLPEGVVKIYANVNVDGIETTDNDVAPDNRMDVQIWLDLDGNGEWDNKREAIILLDTILPSENNENRVVVGDENFKDDSGLHITTFTYEYKDGLRYIVISDIEVT